MRPMKPKPMMPIWSGLGSTESEFIRAGGAGKPGYQDALAATPKNGLSQAAKGVGYVKSGRAMSVSGPRWRWIVKRNLVLVLSLCGLLAPHAGAGVFFKVTTIVIEGNDVPGVGAVTTINNIAVNDAGDWLVEADTDHFDPNADVVMLRNGSLYLREGQAVDPPGATISSFDSVNLNAGVHSGFNFFLDGTEGSTDDSGVYFDTTLVIQESDPVNLPGISPGTPYIGFFDVKINDANQLLIMASIDDPNIESTVDRALIGMNNDGTGGVVFLKEGDLVPGQKEELTDFETGPHATAFNNDGVPMFIVDMTGDTAMDSAVYVGNAVVAQEGSPSDVDLRPWSSLSSARVDLANTGNYVISGSLSGDAATNAVIVDASGKITQEGDPAPGATDFQLTGFGSGPVHITDRDQVLWYGDWDDANTEIDTGLVLDDALLIQEGVTVIDGRLVETVRGIEDGYKISRNGRFILARLEVMDQVLGVVDAVVMIEFCPGDVDLDGLVDQTDLGIVLASFGLCPGETGYSAQANLDTGDPCITQADLGILLSRFGLPCE
jgi:hypothetical protein